MRPGYLCRFLPLNVGIYSQASRTLPKELFHFFCGLLLHRGEHMGIEKGHIHFTMSKHLLHHLGMDSHTCQERCCIMSEIMDVHTWQACFLKKLVELFTY